jgi:signal transduction histidine kinase
MIEWNHALIILALLTIVICIVIVALQHRKLKKTMLKLGQMLDSAIDGSFTEHTFDETLLSSVESKFNRYLTASVVSARNLAAEKEKIKELLADISHQTKTPLSNILLYAQLLEEHNLPNESRDCVTALQGQAEKLNFLISSLVKLSRLETGVFTLHPTSNAIAPMLEEAAGQFMSKAERKGVQFTLDSTAAFAIYDFKWTTESLCNLVDNAIKYTPSGGGVQISVKEYDLFCRIDIIDTGIGVSEEELSKIFTRFYRSPSVSEEEGVGIGLYLTRQILTGQGGYIKVTSTLGAGATFSMFLPREA